MKKKVALADVLWDAANRYLAPSERESVWYPGPSEYTCDAIRRTLLGTGMNFSCEIAPFLKSLGMPDFGFSTFEHVAHTKRQGVRYLWLLLAMHVAEDEGIVIEVEA